MSDATSSRARMGRPSGPWDCEPWHILTDEGTVLCGRVETHELVRLASYQAVSHLPICGVCLNHVGRFEDTA